MKKSLVLLGCIVLLFAFPGSAQMLSPVAQVQGTLNADTQAFFIGKTRISGTFNGIQMDQFQDNPLIDEINILPLLGSTTFKSLDAVKIIDISDLDNESLEDIDTLEDAEGIEFTQVEVVTEKAPFLLATHAGEIDVESEVSYAISSFMNFSFDGNNSYPFLFVVTGSHITSQFNGNVSYIMQSSDEGRVMIKDVNGKLLWSGGSTDYIFVIEDKEFTIFQDSSLYLFPVFSEKALTTTQLSISPADLGNTDIITLIENISDSNLGLGDMSNITEEIGEFSSIIQTASAIVNGGMILIQTNDTFIIDGSSQTFSNIGFARGDAFDVTLSSATGTPTISGDYRLVFLGDHFYTSQAKGSEQGVSLPVLIIIVWVIALLLFILFRFYIHLLKPILLKKEVNEQRDEKIKKYAFIFHITALCIVFILLDREISFQFGTSVLDAALGQGFSLIFVGLLAIELILWVLGFFLLAIPLRIITNSGLRIIGIGKGGKAIGKGVGAFGIWIFCAFYVKLVINFVFLIINPGNLFPMG